MMTADKPILYLVVPCYNEEEVLPETSRRLREKLTALTAEGRISEKSRIVFVNDGSKDKTWEIIAGLHQADPLFCGVCLSRNKGHQNALLAGLMTAKEHADIVISMDADLQDDVDAVDGMIAAYAEGHDVVYGVRSSRKKDSFFKKFTAESFHERFAGESKYPLKKMLAFAFDGITSFSIKPIRLIAFLGLLIFLVSLVMLLWSLISKLVGATVAGWTSIVGSIWMIGGIQLLCLGVIGEYIGKIYAETKHRPKYIIARTLLDEDKNENPADSR